MGLKDEVSKSKYLTKKEIGNGITVTVARWCEEDLSRDDKPEQFETILYFNGVEKGLVLKPTNAGLAQEATGAQTRDELIGKTLQLWFDPDIMFGTEKTGGIRVWVNKPAAQPTFAPPPNAATNQAKIAEAYPRPIASPGVVPFPDMPPKATDADVPADLDENIPY